MSITTISTYWGSKTFDIYVEVWTMDRKNLWYNIMPLRRNKSNYKLLDVWKNHYSEEYVDKADRCLQLSLSDLGSIWILSFLTLSQAKVCTVEATWFKHTSKWQFLRIFKITYIMMKIKNNWITRFFKHCVFLSDPQYA